jgi:hypothetical protein
MGGLSSSVASSRAGGGSPSEPHAPPDTPVVRREPRLRHRKDFDNVFRGGRAWSNNLLVLEASPATCPTTASGS